MTSPDVEHILCARTADLPPAWLPPHGALPLDEGALLDTLERTEPHWLPRPAAESDPTHKQWIPYILLCTRDDLLAVYPRRGSETRLHGLWSCGIGGHINPVDQPPDTAAADRRAFWQRALHNGLQRELREEFPSAAAGITSFLGLIHESRTAVGDVHIGAVYLHRIDTPAADPGPELAGLEWIPRHSLGSATWPLDRFETWSALALQLITDTPPLP